MKTTKIMQHLIGKTYEEVSSHLNIKKMVVTVAAGASVTLTTL